MPDLNFTLALPEPHEPGYMGFIDDAIELSSIAAEGKMSAETWRRLKSFMFSVMATPETEDEKLALLRSMSMDDFGATFEQMFAVLNEKKS